MLYAKKVQAMRHKIVHLRQFYSSALGHKVKRRLRALTLEYWPQHEGEMIVGIGYATPLLRVLERTEGKPSVLVALMPVDQGAIYWPVHADNRSVLADELRPPFAPGTLHRVIMLHAFEHLARPGELLNICWELMVPGGKLLIAVPNRRGLWSRSGGTPFSDGTPYSLNQLKELLASARFTLCNTATALFAPPSTHPLWMKCWNVVEFIGKWLFPGVGGVLVIEAEKQIYAAIPERVAETRKAKAWVGQGAPIATPRDRLV